VLQLEYWKVLLHYFNANIANNTDNANNATEPVAIASLLALSALLELSFRLIRAKCESNDKPACYTRSAISREVR
jgi:hypothetical protein